MDIQDVDANGHIRMMNFVRLDEKTASHAPVAFDWRAEVVTGHPIYQHAVEVQASGGGSDTGSGGEKVEKEVQDTTFDNPLDESADAEHVNELPSEAVPTKNPELLTSYIDENFKSDGAIHTKTDEGFSTFNFGGLDMTDEDLLKLLPFLMHAESPEFISFAGNEQLTDAVLRPLFITFKSFPELSLLASGASGHHSWMWAVQSTMWQTEEYQLKFSKQMELVTEMRAANGKMAASDTEAATEALNVHESGIGEALHRKKMHLPHVGIEALVQHGLGTPEAVDATTEEEFLEYGVDIIAAKERFTRYENSRTKKTVAAAQVRVTCPPGGVAGDTVEVDYAGETFNVQVPDPAHPNLVSSSASDALCLRVAVWKRYPVEWYKASSL